MSEGNMRVLDATRNDATCKRRTHSLANGYEPCLATASSIVDCSDGDRIHAGFAAHLGPNADNAGCIDALCASGDEVVYGDSLWHVLPKDMWTNVTDVVLTCRDYGESRTSPGLRPGGTRTPKSDLKIGSCDHSACHLSAYDLVDLHHGAKAVGGHRNLGEGLHPAYCNGRRHSPTVHGRSGCIGGH